MRARRSSTPLSTGWTRYRAHVRRRLHRSCGRTDDAPEADVRGGRFDHLRLPGGRPVAQAVVRRAEMRAALGDPPRNRRAWRVVLEALSGRIHARVVRRAAGTSGLLGML